MIEPFYGTLRPADKAPGAAQIYHIANETGTGKLTVCPVFAGVELCYNDMHLAWCNQDQQAARNVIEINHCRVGYENPNKFSSAFRDAFGQTPTECRKRCLNG